MPWKSLALAATFFEAQVLPMLNPIFRTGSHLRVFGLIYQLKIVFNRPWAARSAGESGRLSAFGGFASLEGRMDPCGSKTQCSFGVCRSQEASALPAPEDIGHSARCLFIPPSEEWNAHS